MCVHIYIYIDLYTHVCIYTRPLDKGQRIARDLLRSSVLPCLNPPKQARLRPHFTPHPPTHDHLPHPNILSHRTQFTHMLA